MTSLASLLGLVTARLQAHPLCERMVVVQTKEYSDQQFLFKVRASLHGELTLQVRIYHNQGHNDYSYQLFSDVPLLRWDNKEDCPDLPNFPHHHHTQDGEIVASALSGEPEKDLPVVLQAVDGFLRRDDGERAQG